MMHRLLVIAYAVLFALGVALFPLTLRTTPLSDIILMLVCLGLLAGFVEAIAVAYTGKRRWIWAWLPPIVGLLISLMILVVPEYQDPDFFLAVTTILPNLFLAGTILFALLVHGLATGVLWLVRLRIWIKHST